MMIFSGGHCLLHRPQFERFFKVFCDEHERHLAELVHAFCVHFVVSICMDFCAKVIDATFKPLMQSQWNFVSIGFLQIAGSESEKKNYYLNIFYLNSPSSRSTTRGHFERRRDLHPFRRRRTLVGTHNFHRYNNYHSQDEHRLQSIILLRINLQKKTFKFINHSVKWRYLTNNGLTMVGQYDAIQNLIALAIQHFALCRWTFWVLYAIWFWDIDSVAEHFDWFSIRYNVQMRGYTLIANRTPNSSDNTRW